MRDGNDISTLREAFQVRLSLRSIVLSVAAATVIPYMVGRVGPWKAGSSILPLKPSLPAPILPEGKSKPDAIYSGKHFHTGVPTRKSDVLLDYPAETAMNGDSEVEVEATGSFKTVNSPTVEGYSDDEVHEPAGQHLLIDIKNIDADFLNSEERLANAMLTLIDMSELTLLSYHCHGLEPMGVSCAGVLLESHVSFHTWPVPGVITLDLFTCGPKSLMPLVAVIEQLFAIPQKPNEGEEVEKPRLMWAHKKRGFQDEEEERNPEGVELEHFLLGWMDYDLKQHIASVKTPFQTVDVFETINSRFHSIEEYEKSLSKDGSYESQHPELFKPDRVVYLDSIMQSRLSGLEGYHEALVHPAMLAHEEPRRVAIIGGGEGATLREVLKHNTVEKCVMVEIDEVMVNASRTYLPEWSDCSDFVGSTRSCFDDPRAEVYYEDAIGWFLNRFSGDVKDIDPSEKFDVIIMDALDPASVVEFSDILYGDKDFVTALRNALTDSGVLVAQVGIDSEESDAGWAHSKQGRTMATMVEVYQEVGFDSMKHYSEMHGGFMAPWSFVITFLDPETKVNWYSNQAEIDLVLDERAMPTISGGSPFKFIDGATMMGYQYPHRSVENVYCRDTPRPELCKDGHGFEPETLNAPITSFEVKTSQIPGAGRGIFFKVDTPKGTYLAIEESVHTINFVPRTRNIIKQMEQSEASTEWNFFHTYLFGYGFATDFYGDTATIVDPTIFNFINHGCNSTYNTGSATKVTELTADPEVFPDELYVDPVEGAFFSPFADRNHWVYVGGSEKSMVDVTAGTELKDNYLNYLVPENWASAVMDYRAQCLFQGAGVIMDYEDESEE